MLLLGRFYFLQVPGNRFARIALSVVEGPPALAVQGSDVGTGMDERTSTVEMPVCGSKVQRGSHALLSESGLGAGTKKAAEDSDVARASRGVKWARSNKPNISCIGISSFPKEHCDNGVATFLRSPVQERSAAVSGVWIGAESQCLPEHSSVTSDTGDGEAFVLAHLPNSGVQLQSAPKRRTGRRGHLPARYPRSVCCNALLAGIAPL